MADKPKIIFSTNPNPRNRALIDGLIPIDGYDLENVGDKYSAGEIHYRFVQGEFDVAEMSTATLMRAKEKGKRFLALPVFFQRGPRQRNIFFCEGKLSAALVAGDSGYPGLFGGGVLPGVMGQEPGVKPLFEDTDEIIKYVKRTQIYPIIHIMTIKEETVEKYPDLAAKLIEAFREANRLAPKYFKNGDAAGYAKERDVLGYDPYACVLTNADKKSIQALNRYQIEQGLVQREIPLESLFVKEAFRM